MERGARGGGFSQQRLEHWGGPRTCPQPCVREPREPRPPLSCSRQPLASARFLSPAAAILGPWAGTSGAGGGEQPARARASPGTAEAPRAQLCHQGPTADVPNTPGTGPSRPTPRAAPGHPGADRGGTGSGMVPTEPSGRSGGAGQDLATLPRSGRHRRPIRPGIRPRDLPAGRGRNRPSS